MPGVYPRVCGGTPPRSVSHSQVMGLSPRVRGNRLERPLFLRNDRSIPACAGEPDRASRAGLSAKVYPRVCGGTACHLAVDALNGGLSPRVRGNLLSYGRRSWYRRSIPACAGEPRTRRLRGFRIEVYPRVCGGTFRLTIPPCRSAGLSPRVRGNPHVPIRDVRIVGSIPACAGEPPRLPSRCCDHQVYPACAGEPERRPSRPALPRVYPRVCGGTPLRLMVVHPFDGLSPRVRGNRMCWGAAHPDFRSIPACAGEPMPPLASVVKYTVYPRVCGEPQWERRMR